MMDDWRLWCLVTSLLLHLLHSPHSYHFWSKLEKKYLPLGFQKPDHTAFIVFIVDRVVSHLLESKFPWGWGSRMLFYVLISK